VRDGKKAMKFYLKNYLKQGGSFKINGVLVEVKPTDKMLTSRGEQDGGVLKVDPLARF
jgi:hypothetical protein